MTEFDQLLGEEANRPPGPATGRVGAGQGEEVSFHVTVELARRAGDLRWSEGGFESLVDKPLADPLDGANADFAGLTDLLIDRVFGNVCLEQDQGVFDATRSSLPSGDHLSKSLPLVIGEGNQVLLVHWRDSFPR